MAGNTAFLKVLDDLRAAGRAGMRPVPVHVALGLAELAKRQVLSGAVSEGLPAMMAGIAAYQSHPFRRVVPTSAEIWRKGEASLLHFPRATKKKKRGGIFIVPSMINRSVILDLLPEKSFVRWLAAKGFDVFLLDWGKPVKDDGMATMDGVIVERLLPAMEFAAKEAGGKIHAIGYCMGGTLLAAGAALSPAILKSAIFLASPWDFHAGDQTLASLIKTGAPAAEMMIAQNGFLPAEWIQSVFAAINAERTVTKFANFTALEPDSAALRLFVAAEDWLNEGVDLPADVAKICLHEWYGTNAPGGGAWTVDDVPVDLSEVNVPALVVASARDRLVPAESSLAMAKVLHQAETLRPDIGHVGMMTGRECERVVWEKVREWLDGNGR
ncbi:MAG TPA: alpha/beta fold hydrolase [Micavibrio sp.]|jgi:poly(3-hydroxyalkanoate) synthetase